MNRSPSDMAADEMFNADARMTAQPSSQAEREDVALRACPFCDAAEIISSEENARYGLEGPACPRCGARAISDAAWNLRPDREHATPRSMPEEVVEALQAIVQRADAYPDDIFGKPDLDAVNAALAAAGLSNQMDRMHASWARRCLTDVGNEARAALALIPGASA